MATTKSPFKHVLLIASPGWGHFRPLISIACKIAHERSDIIVTFTMTDDFEHKLKVEIDRYFKDDEEPRKSHIRLLQLGKFEGLNLFQLIQEYSKEFAKVYPAIYAEDSVHCATGRVYPPTPKPNVILLDPFLYDMLQTVRKVSGRVVPVLTWNLTALNSSLHFFGPESFGGLGNVSSKAEILAKETGKPVDDIIRELFNPEVGELIKLPGMPPMYDYEFNPQHEDVRNENFSRFFEESDGIVALGNASFDPEACAAYKTWFAPRPAYIIGPLLPEEPSIDGQLSESQTKELTASPNGIEIRIFLDTVWKTYGDRSLLYISFGSHFWPHGEGVWKVIEVILEMKIPLILSFNSKDFEMPFQMQKRLDSSNIALVSTWVPQHVILGHPVTGWFMTHCGNNSVTESVSHGVPMIAWPLSADQPVNAAYMSSVLNIAYELFETRIGSGLRPLYRGIKPQGALEAIETEIRTVLQKAWGCDGARKRENILKLKEKLNIAWNEDGEARIELREFLKRFCS
ncbi:hypothetical protein Clacol_010497 [Clathrus columnatus]|uniref:Uncharacterized protein n=1 Tax=Clathrus columnatus TaxID=1419009 RepID=A0AAV5ANH1_9AGAM|nr:hypothetical protein Clacol_010497 [Clathrus columnatus]